MYCIVHAPIHEITKQEARKEHECISLHQQIHQRKNNWRQDQTGNRRHKQALSVAGIMMVIPVKHVNYFSCPFTFSRPVKEKPVGEIFKKCPEKHTPDKSQNDTQWRIVEMTSSIIQHECNDRQIDAPDHQRVSFCKHFKVLILEKLSLALIMNFLEFHRPQKYEVFSKTPRITDHWRGNETSARFYFLILTFDFELSISSAANK